MAKNDGFGGSKGPELVLFLVENGQKVPFLAKNVIGFLNTFLKDCIGKKGSKNVFFFKSRKNPVQTPIYIVDIYIRGPLAGLITG